MAARSEPFRPEAPSIAELASGGIVRRRSDGAILLLHEVDEDRWCLPKGHVEPGESLAAAARREILEESGLADVEIGVELVVVHYRFYQPARARNVLKTVVYFDARSEGTGKGLESGFDAARWATRSEARTLVRFPADRDALASLGTAEP